MLSQSQSAFGTFVQLFALAKLRANTTSLRFHLGVLTQTVPRIAALVDNHAFVPGINLRVIKHHTMLIRTLLPSCDPEQDGCIEKCITLGLHLDDMVQHLLPYRDDKELIAVTKKSIYAYLNIARNLPDGRMDDVARGMAKRFLSKIPQ